MTQANMMAKKGVGLSSLSEKKLLLAVSEDQWLGLRRIGLDQRKTLKAVCLDAFDAYIANTLSQHLCRLAA